jgi:hypothetical protein
MKRKIQHDAINNQEDEDSSAYPLYFSSEDASAKKKKGAIRNGIHYFTDKSFKNKDELEQRRK